VRKSKKIIFNFCYVIIFSSSKLAELISIKELSNEERDLKSGFSCDSLSLISYKTIRKDIEEPINSFYLGKSFYLKEKEIINSLPTIKLRSNQINTLPQLSKRRSIIRDLTILSNSLKQNKMNQSVDSIFSKDSLIE